MYILNDLYDALFEKKKIASILFSKIHRYQINIIQHLYKKFPITLVGVHTQRSALLNTWPLILPMNVSDHFYRPILQPPLKHDF